MTLRDGFHWHLYHGVVEFVLSLERRGRKRERERKKEREKEGELHCKNIVKAFSYF